MLPYDQILQHHRVFDLFNCAQRPNATANDGRDFAAMACARHCFFVVVYGVLSEQRVVHLLDARRRTLFVIWRCGISSFSFGHDRLHTPASAVVGGKHHFSITLSVTTSSPAMRRCRGDRGGRAQSGSPSLQPSLWTDQQNIMYIYVCMHFKKMERERGE